MRLSTGLSKKISCFADPGERAIWPPRPAHPPEEGQAQGPELHKRGTQARCLRYALHTLIKHQLTQSKRNSGEKLDSSREARACVPELKSGEKQAVFSFESRRSTRYHPFR
jgi:hypothetical protein